MSATESIEPLFVGVHEAQRVLGLGRSTVYELMSTGELESVHVRGRRLIPVDELRGFAHRVRLHEGAQAQ